MQSVRLLSAGFDHAQTHPCHCFREHATTTPDLPSLSSQTINRIDAARRGFVQECLQRSATVQGPLLHSSLGYTTGARQGFLFLQSQVFKTFWEALAHLNDRLCLHEFVAEQFKMDSSAAMVAHEAAFLGDIYKANKFGPKLHLPVDTYSALETDYKNGMYAFHFVYLYSVMESYEVHMLQFVARLTGQPEPSKDDMDKLDKLGHALKLLGKSDKISDHVPWQFFATRTYIRWRRNWLVHIAERHQDVEGLINRHGASLMAFWKRYGTGTRVFKQSVVRLPSTGLDQFEFDDVTFFMGLVRVVYRVIDKKLMAYLDRRSILEEALSTYKRDPRLDKRTQRRKFKVHAIDKFGIEASELELVEIIPGV